VLAWSLARRGSARSRRRTGGSRQIAGQRRRSGGGERRLNTDRQRSSRRRNRGDKADRPPESPPESWGRSRTPASGCCCPNKRRHGVARPHAVLLLSQRDSRAEPGVSGVAEPTRAAPGSTAATLAADQDLPLLTPARRRLQPRLALQGPGSSFVIRHSSFVILPSPGQAGGAGQVARRSFSLRCRGRITMAERLVSAASR